MGNCGGGELTADQKRQLLRSRNLDSLVHKKNDEYSTSVKILLLGTGDSGKSTFVRQIKSLHGTKGLDVEVKKFVDIVKRNCLENMQNFLAHLQESSYIDIPSKIQSSVDPIMSTSVLTKDVASTIYKLSKNTDFIQLFREFQSSAQIPTTSIYFWEHARRIVKPDYEPTKDDIIRAKLRTTGIIETSFIVNDTRFNMVDVGGQRSERRKWLHCFDNVDATIFLCAIDEYNGIYLEEDRETDRFFESLSLFEKLSASTFLSQIPFILFLNKTDLFFEKLESYPLSDFPDKFSDFPRFAAKREGTDQEIAMAYFKNKFKKKYAGEGRFFVYFTCALDENQCSNVFNAIREEVIAEAVNNVAL
eukprot:TRINITY_DN708_c1_g1_i1.p1 TRINITY_DN708_c1_g1~~TRINITY_DN708_c1_g1_i1.p1  ORF type:complete len:371 (+),score=74.58 TRINITY_DN708_c1_g1_i1:31-1113(+)